MTVADQALTLVERTTTACGFPIKITDPGTIVRIVAMVTARPIVQAPPCQQEPSASAARPRRRDFRSDNHRSPAPGDR